MELQKITQEDGQLVLDFVLACNDYFSNQQQTPPLIETILTDFFETRPPETLATQKEVFAILDQHRIIGLVDLLHDYPTVKTTILGLMVFRPEYRRLGLGTHYFHYFQEYCRGLGQQTLRLGVLEANHGGGIMWQKMGFHAVGETAGLQGRLIIMEKTIN